MTGRPGISRRLAGMLLLGLVAGCHLPGTERASIPVAAGPVDARTGYAAGTIVPAKPKAATEPNPPSPFPAREGGESPLSAAGRGLGVGSGKLVARGAAPGEPAPQASAKQKAAALTATRDDEPEWRSASSAGSGIAKLPRLNPPILIREEREDLKLPVAPDGLPDITIAPAVRETPEPPITPIAVQPTPPVRLLPAVPDTAPAQLPPLTTTPPLPSASDAPVGPIIVGDHPLAFDSLSKLVDGQGCGPGGAGCASCGGDCPPGRPCAAGGRKCEPFPESHNPVTRFVGLVYQNVCCPDPCYEPKWEPLADAAFFIDAPRPINNTRFRWDYGNHLTYPDRGEYFWARADGSGKGPKATDSRVKTVPYIDYHEISVVSEIATGKSSVAISVPYRTVNTTPFGKDAAGFSDMTVTAKSLLVDSELFMVALQTRTYIPTGNFGKGLGVGHVSIEPGLLFGLRLTPNTYMQGQVIEWIPIAGDADYASAHLRWGASVNHVLWRPVKDVQLIGTLELNGISFQDGLFTDPVKGPQKLSGLNALSVGNGYRLFFCDTFDVGVAGTFGITGKYLVREQLRFEMRFRY